MTEPAAHPSQGDLIAGKYRVEEVLGSGGMGIVVAARHITLPQRVAIKLLRPRAMSVPDARARFLREAQAAVSIQGEHVARVVDVGTLDDGVPYMVMEHLAGCDLSRLLKQRGRLPAEDAIDYVLQAGEALAEAHALGIVHRDLKPGNLFLTHRPDGSPLVKVLDFGLSKMTLADDSADGAMTATTVVVGSPYYMSPEQVRSLKNVDARTDLWAMGVILYELLSGRRPFDGPSVTAICASVVADSPAPLQGDGVEVAPGLPAVILRCLEKDPARRLQSMAELARALKPFAAARSVGSIERIERIVHAAESGAHRQVLSAPVDVSDAAMTLMLEDRVSRLPLPPPEQGAAVDASRLSAPQIGAAPVVMAPPAAPPAPVTPAESAGVPPAQDASGPSVTTGSIAMWSGEAPLRGRRTGPMILAGGLAAVLLLGAAIWAALPGGAESPSAAAGGAETSPAISTLPVTATAPAPAAPLTAGPTTTATAEPSATAAPPRAMGAEPLPRGGATPKKQTTTTKPGTPKPPGTTKPGNPRVDPLNRPD